MAILSPGDENGPFEKDLTKGTPALWLADLGAWTINGQPVPEPLATAITDHARALEVPGF